MDESICPKGKEGEYAEMRRWFFLLGVFLVACAALTGQTSIAESEATRIQEIDSREKYGIATGSASFQGSTPVAVVEGNMAEGSARAGTGSPTIPKGRVIRSWPTGLAAGWGIVYDGKNDTIWVANAGPEWGGDGTLREYSLDGKPTGRSHPFTWAPQNGPADMAFNQNTGTIWVMNVGYDDFENCIFEMDPETGYTGKSICPDEEGFKHDQRGLAYDPVTDTYFAGGWRDQDIYRFDSSGRITEVEESTDIDIAGLAFNPDTRHLFVINDALYGPSGIYVMDVEDDYPIEAFFRVSEGFQRSSGAGLAMDCSGNLWAIDRNRQIVYQFTSGETTSACGPRVSLKVDDGSYEKGVGLDGGGQFLWLNRFTPDPGDFPLTVRQVQAVFGNDAKVGDDIDVLIMKDDDGDGNPCNASVLHAESFKVQANDKESWSIYSLNKPVSFESSGDVIIGLVNRSGKVGYQDKPAALDTGKPSGRSWLATFSQSTVPSPVTMPPTLSCQRAGDAGHPGNWMLRADIVPPAKPVTAGFKAEPLKGVAPLEVQFKNKSEGEITQRQWDFGDGSISVEKAPKHVYTQPGSYSVRLWVSGPGAYDLKVRDDYIFVDDPEDYYTLLIQKTGTGKGRVLSSPAGIDCGKDCEGLFKEDSKVTLTAVPFADSSFKEWSSNTECPPGPTCEVTMEDDDKRIEAKFIAVGSHAPDLFLSELSGPHKANRGDSMEVTVVMGNQGKGPAKDFRIGIYLSRNATIEPKKEILLGVLKRASLEKDKSWRTTAKVTIPRKMDPGDYYLGARVDRGNDVAEYDEFNNSFVTPTTMRIGR